MDIKPYQKLAWFGTLCLLVSAVMAALNVYPWYIYAFIFSNSLWVLVGYLWKEKSLIALNAGLTLIYILGVLVKSMM
tara:strand:+ start:352 stop:582 length:231 start_codon:yes stop_codon:yes gene_type:complete